MTSLIPRYKWSETILIWNEGWDKSGKFVQFGPFIMYFLWAIKLVAVDFEKFQRRAKLIKRGFIWSIGYSHVISPLLRCDTIAETGAMAVSVILVNITKCKNMRKVGKLPLRTEVKKNWEIAHVLESLLQYVVNATSLIAQRKYYFIYIDIASSDAF